MECSELGAGVPLDSQDRHLFCHVLPAWHTAACLHLCLARELKALQVCSFVVHLSEDVQIHTHAA